MATKIIQIMPSTDNWYAHIVDGERYHHTPVIGWALVEYASDKVISALVVDETTGRAVLVTDMKDTFKGLSRIADKEPERRKRKPEGE